MGRLQEPELEDKHLEQELGGIHRPVLLGSLEQELEPQDNQEPELVDSLVQELLGSQEPGHNLGQRMGILGWSLGVEHGSLWGS